MAHTTAGLHSMRRWAWALLGSFALTCHALAYELSGNSWPSGDLRMVLQLDATRPTNVNFPLVDGATNWNAIAASVLEDWNAQLTRLRFTSTTSTSPVAEYERGAATKVNNVLFAESYDGDAFGVNQLAITLSDQSFRKNQADVVVNKAAYTWNSYRGGQRPSGPDLRRVLLHEFGHVIGLGHPNQAVPAQSVTAIMNSVSGNTETLQLDDTNGARFLYSAAVKPVITTQPISQSVSVTGSASFSSAVDGQSTFSSSAIRDYTWLYAPSGSDTFESLQAQPNPARLELGLAQLTDAGRYRLAILTPDELVMSEPATLAVNPVTLSTTTQLANVATRGVAGSGANSMIVGFTVTGPKPKKILLRGIGPTLESTFQVPGALADPILTLNTTSGAFVARNNNWSEAILPNTSTAAEIRNAAASVGAFSLTEGSADSVLLITLDPGGYTAVVSSPTNASGVVLLEAYDAESPLDPAIRLSNLSTRGFVGTGADIMIAGFFVNGPGPKTYLIRAIGPTLLDAPFNLAGSLTDPFLRLYRDGTLLREIDDWDFPAANQPGLRSVMQRAGAFPLREVRKDGSGLDAVLLLTLPPGSYSAQMSGFESATGIGLIELYEVPN